jgi:hypothetical protein
MQYNTTLTGEWNRPLFSTQERTISIKVDGTGDYPTIQDALNDIPYFLSHQYYINLECGYYPENLYVPPFTMSSIISSVEGSTEGLWISGGVHMQGCTSIDSIHIGAVKGATNPVVRSISFVGIDPYSDENVSVSVYGTDMANLKYLHFDNMTAKYPIMIYGGNSVIVGTNFGDNVNDNAVLLKHGGIVRFNNQISYGTLKGNLFKVDGGDIHIGNSIENLFWVGEIASYPDDHAGIITSRDITNDKYTLHHVNNFDGDINVEGIIESDLVVTNKFESLVGYWAMDENVSGRIIDYVSDNDAITNIDLTSIANDNRGLGRLFTGNEYATINSSKIPQSGNFTYSVWFKTNQATIMTLFDNDATGGGWRAEIGTSGVVRMDINATTQQSSTLAYNDNEWYNFVISYDSTLNQISYYINGELIKTFTGSTTISSSTRDVSIIGARQATGQRRFIGSMDEIMLFNETLTAREVSQVYHSSRNSIVTKDNMYFNVAGGTIYGDVTISANQLFKLQANTTALTCDATNAGSIYYDGTQLKHYGCNSTDWNAMY